LSLSFPTAYGRGHCSEKPYHIATKGIVRTFQATTFVRLNLFKMLNRYSPQAQGCIFGAIFGSEKAVQQEAQHKTADVCVL